MSDLAFDPDAPSDERRDRERLIALAVDLYAAIGQLDGERAIAWRRCRGAALRYLETLRDQRFRPTFALRVLRGAVDTWAPSDMDVVLRAELDFRLSFWVETAYGLRWRVAVHAPEAPSPIGMLLLTTSRLIAARASIEQQSIARVVRTVARRQASRETIAMARTCIEASRIVRARSREILANMPAAL